MVEHAWPSRFAVPPASSTADRDSPRALRRVAPEAMVARMLRIISWNMGRRTEAWRGLFDRSLAEGADVALLQEACPPPADAYGLRIFPAPTEGWTTAGLARGAYRTAIVGLSDRVDVILRATAPLGASGDAMPVSRPGTITVADVRLRDSGETLTVASIYAFWEKPCEGAWIVADASAHRLVSDLSWLIGRQRGHRIIAAGDLNLLRGYGENGSAYWKLRYQTVFDRFAALGVPFVGPRRPGGHAVISRPAELPERHDGVPTFRTAIHDPASATRQLDYVFASTSLVPRLAVRALNGPDEWGPSDHCRVSIDVAAS